MATKTKARLLEEIEALKKRIDELETHGISILKAEERTNMLSLALEQSTNGIAIINTEGVVEYVNPKLLEIYKYPGKKILGTNWRSFLSMDSSLRESLPEIRETVLVKGNAWKGEVCDRTSTGKTAWRQATIFPIKDAHDRITHSVYISEDITEGKLWLDVLKAEKEQAQKYLDIAATIFVAINAKGDVILINKKGCEILGYDKEEEIIGKNWFDNFLPKAQVKQVKAVFRKLIAGKTEPVEYYENTVVTKSGTERIIAWHNTIITDDEGNIAGTLSSGEDITERHRAIKDLEKSEQRFRSLVEHTTEAIFCFEYDHPVPTGLPAEEQVRLLYGGVLAECNNIAAKAYGAERAEDVTGKKLTDIFGTIPGSLDRLFRQFVKDGYRTVDGEGMEILPDGARRYFLNNAHGVIESGKLVRVWGTYQDITERRKTEKLLRIQKDIGIACGGASNLEEILDSLMDMAMQMDDVDSGGVYLRDLKTGGLNLVVYRGLPEEFVKVASHYDKDMPQARLVMKGEPIHLHYFKLGIPFDEGHKKEPLKAISIIPIKHENEVIGALNLASHAVDEFSPATRDVVESIAGMIGESIAHAQAEAAVQEVNARMRAVMESSKDVIIFSLDRNYNYTSFNQAHREEVRMVYGVEIELGMSLLEFISIPKARKIAKKSFNRVLSGESFTEVQEQPGLGIFYEFMWNPIRDEKGKVTGIAAFIQNITERKQTQEALREERDFAESLIETAQVIILVLDMEGRIVRFNPYMEEISGYKFEEVQGKEWFSTFLPHEDNDKIKELFKKAAADIRTKGNISFIITKNGNKREIIWYDKTLKNGKGDAVGLLAVGQDITERREMEDRLRQAEKMEAVGQLAGGIAHDFNNQLAGIMGYGDLMREAVADDPTLYRYADGILSCVKRSADLTAQLLAFSRKGKYFSIPVDIHRIVFEVVNLLQHSIDKKIELRQHLKANPPVTVGDSSQLQNAILNLALNARDAMPEGGKLSFSTSIEHLDKEYCKNSSYDIAEGDYIQVSVTDTGTGIDKENLERIFEPFFTTKEEGKGTGMGLAAVYGTVRNHKGAVNVYSEIGHGTTFSIYLPLVCERSEIKQGSAEEEKFVKGTAHILLVEDEDILCDLAYEMLADLGYEVVVCKDGKQAIEYYKDAWKKIDLVILDLIMPGVGGKEAFFAMRYMNPDIKVLLSSGYSVDGEAQNILDEGAKGFIQKPFRKAELSKKVAEVLNVKG